MRPFFTLTAKLVRDSRWPLLVSAAALFALGWLFVHVASLNETRILKTLSAAPGEKVRAFRWMRDMGLEDAPSSTAIMMAFWNHPFIVLVVAIWAIGRGAGAVGAEIERGGLDLVLSRPISRSAYLTAQAMVATAGLLAIASSLAAGAWIGSWYNVLRSPPEWLELLRPALNLAALGFAVYGYTLLFSSMDLVRWRPTMLGSVLTLAGFIARVIALIPIFKDEPWRPWAERVSIFSLYNPVDAVTGREVYSFDVSVLAGLGAACVGLAFLVFATRDLPANG